MNKEEIEKIAQEVYENRHKGKPHIKWEYVGSDIRKMYYEMVSIMLELGYRKAG